MVSGDQLHFHQIQKGFSDKIQGIELYFKLDKKRDICYSLEVVESVDEPCEMSLALVLLLQPGASEPVPGVVILGPGLGAHVDHELHAGGHLLLHLQRQHQGLQQNKFYCVLIPI